jgi:hypothetical protein
MRFLFFKITLYLSSFILLCSCGDSTSSGIAQRDRERDVSFSINCENGVLCNNATRVSPLSYGNGILCEWDCGNYKDYKRYTVMLYFSKLPNECWKFDHESVWLSNLCR